MELTHLKYFLEVARTEHVTQSAKTLCIVQPALTHALHKLEEELGVKLFKTQGRNIKLTEIGEYFYKKVKPLYEDIESLPAQLRAMENEQSATVNLNVLAASSFVTNAVILYKRNDPDLRFNLVQNEETTLYDICVRTYANYKASVRHYGGEDSEEENFVCTENIYLAVPNTAQYRKRDSISLKELQETNFIGLYGSKQLRSIFNEYCERIGFKTHITFESDNALAVKDAIASGIGVGFWPEFSWGRVNNRRIRLLKITDAEFKRDIVITLRKNKQDNSRSERFYQFLTVAVKARLQPQARLGGASVFAIFADMDRARRRKFGQNFLDVPTAQMIAGDLPAQAGEAVLEIGPGHGALTEHLLDRAVQLTAVEIDEQCVEFLEQKFQGRENFRIENIDFLKFDLQAFLEAHEKPWVTETSWYNVSTAIIAGLMPKLHLTKGFMGMVQLEVAERICAAPCSSNYGSLSVLVSAYADTQILRKIGPEHFTPRPNVDSATMLLTPKADALQAPEGFFDFVRAAFTQKRKTLANSFGRAYDKKKIQEAIELLDYPTTVRAEELSPAQFLEFYRVIGDKEK